MLCLIVSANDPAAAFYLPFTRLWEPLLGAALVGVTTAGVSLETDGKRKAIASLAGAGLVCLGAVLVNDRLPYPSWYAVLPAAGTALIIWCGARAWINKHVLGNGVIVRVGLISYPLYLWHWPLVSFAYILDGKRPSTQTSIILIAVSFILSWLTYRFVERPLRFGKPKPWKVAGLSMGMLAVAVTGLSLYAKTR